MKKVAIITFSNAYNCGSMLESYAIQKVVRDRYENTVIINFSNKGQKEIYTVGFRNNSLKNIIKNILIFPFKNKINNNNNMYERFKEQNFILTKEYNSSEEIVDDKYDYVIAGSDQIWNITIEDGDIAYFLPWVKNAKKIAYAPSFGAKNISKYAKNKELYRELISKFDYLSVRETNGQKWIKDLTGLNAELLIDPTLILSSEDYNSIIDNSCTPKFKYIFFYCPGFDRNICKFVKKVSKKYKLPVICWSTKSYATNLVYTYGFKLPKYENPSVYLSLIKNASLVFTTSFHGTIFSTIFKRKFYTLKNGGMYADDDRVKTLLEQIGMTNRLISFEYNSEFDYMNEIDYKEYDTKIIDLKKKANDYLDKSLDCKNEKHK